MKSERVLDSYVSFRRSIINKLKRLIKERGEAKISSIFADYSKVLSEYVFVFIEHNKELCLNWDQPQRFYLYA